MAHSNITPRYRRTKNTTTITTIFSPLIIIIIIIIITTILFLLLQNPSASPASATNRFSGDLRYAYFSWNSLPLSSDNPPPISLKIGVFTRKWPVSAAPGGMERHAFELHSALARRGHRVHVFTAAPPEGVNAGLYSVGEYPKVHFLEGTPGRWQCGDAFVMFEEEDRREKFDVVHSESVSLYHRFCIF